MASTKSPLTKVPVADVTEGMRGMEANNYRHYCGKDGLLEDWKCNGCAEPLKDVKKVGDVYLYYHDVVIVCLKGEEAIPKGKDKAFCVPCYVKKKPQGGRNGRGGRRRVQEGSAMV